MDNFFPECPAVMSDARFLQDYQDSIRRDEHIKYVNKIYRDDEYRTFLQNNGKKIISNLWEQQVSVNKCWVNNCNHVGETRASLQDYINEMNNYNNPSPKSQCKKYKDYTLLAE